MKKWGHLAVLLLFAGCSNSKTQVATTQPDALDGAHFEEHSDMKAQADTLQHMSSAQFSHLEPEKIIQSRTSSSSNPLSQYEPAINSPKSAIYTPDGKKFYIQSLEGFQTVVFDAKTLKKIKTIDHVFNEKNQYLFKNNETTIFDYRYKQNRDNLNYFSGKPVEMTMSHNGRYLWVSYYRRSWDNHAESPSAIAIIDTNKDEIVRVMPSGPLPKMLATSPNNRYVAVTHWGDNTVGLIDINSNNPQDFKYTTLIDVDQRMQLNFNSPVNRDVHCGNCLRGTVFTPDNQKLLVGKMGGNGIAVIDVPSAKYEGTITGSYLNVRHLIINNGNLIISTNKYGFVQSAPLQDILSTPFDSNKNIHYTNWKNVFVGAGARTIDVSKDGRYIFAAVNNAAKVVVVDAKTMKVIQEVSAAQFPVGMALSPDERQLLVTSQGKSSTPGSGNTVSVFKVIMK